MQTTMQFTSTKAARDKGHAAGDGCARKAGSEWVEQAVEYVAHYCTRVNPWPFTMDELRSTANDLAAPHDARAWGTVTRQAVARGIIVRTGGYRAAVSSNGSPKPLYRKA